MKGRARYAGLALLLVLLLTQLTACNAVLARIFESRYERQARANLNRQIEALDIPADFKLLHRFDQASTISMGIQSWADAELVYGTNSSIETALSAVEWGFADSGWERYVAGPGDNPWQLSDQPVVLNLFIRSNREFSAGGFKPWQQWDTQVEDAAPYATIVIIRLHTTVDHPL